WPVSSSRNASDGRRQNRWQESKSTACRVITLGHSHAGDPFVSNQTLRILAIDCRKHYYSWVRNCLTVLCFHLGAHMRYLKSCLQLSW
ncbi:hypothetical protein ABZP36_007238, partial [Zizania latifolia]